MTIIAAADGSALGNPGPAGWGWYVDEDCWAVGGWAHGTNNMAELTAVLDLLQQTAHLHSSSTYQPQPAGPGLPSAEPSAAAMIVTSRILPSRPGSFRHGRPSRRLS